MVGQFRFGKHLDGGGVAVGADRRGTGAVSDATKKILRDSGTRFEMMM